MSNLKPSEIRAGDYYYAKKEEGYRVTKVLVIDSFCVHIQIFKNVFSSPPTVEDIPGLTFVMKAEDIKEGKIISGIQHVPLDTQGFIATNPVWFARLPVTEEELVGYREWQRRTGLLDD